MMRLLLLMIMAVAGGAGEVELMLNDGSRMHGTIISEDETTLEISAYSLKRGEVKTQKFTLPLDRIAKRIDLRPLAMELAEREQKLDGSPQALLALAQWLLDRAQVEPAVVRVREAMELDPHGAWGKTLMAQAGYLNINGQWVKESTHLAATGQVRFGNELISASEATIRKRQFGLTLERDRLVAQLAQVTAASAVTVDAKAAQKRLDDATKALETLTKQRQDTIARRQAGSDKTLERHNLTLIDQKIGEQQSVQSKAKTEVDEASAKTKAAETAKARLPELKAQIAKLETELATGLNGASSTAALSASSASTAGTKPGK